MSTGPTHAVMGLTAWAGISLLALAQGQHVDPQTWLACATITAGAALLPDLDHPPATVAHSFGPVTQVLSHGVDKLSVGIYNVVRLSGDPHRKGGHRTFTHTVVFAALAGVITSALVLMHQPWVTALVLFFFCGLGVRGLLHEWDHHASTFVVLAASGFITWECWRWVDTGGDRAAWCGVAVITGCLAHCFGDAITEDGCPFLWPIPLGRHLWYPIGPPTPMRYRTGGKVEMLFVGPLCTVISVWLAALALQWMNLIPWLRGVPLVPHFHFDLAATH